MNTLEFSLVCAVYTFAYSQNMGVSPIKNVDVFYLDDYIVEAINGKSNLVSEIEYRKFIKTCKKNGINLRFIKADCDRDISIIKESKEKAKKCLTKMLLSDIISTVNGAERFRQRKTTYKLTSGAYQ